MRTLLHTVAEIISVSLHKNQAYYVDALALGWRDF